MGFTIEDMMTVSRSKYKMELLAGERGWSNSISWILLVEDIHILKNFKGKDLAVTTGFGFDTPGKLLELVRQLVQLHASGLIVNIGPHIESIPPEVRDCCDANDFPLLTIPWSTQIYDMIKDLSLRVLLQSAADEQISAALIRAIEHPDAPGLCEKDLLPYFDVDGVFQVVLISNGELDVMDTVERRRIGYRMQIYLENITHNAHFFYYDSHFTLVMNDMTTDEVQEILDGFLQRVKRKMTDTFVAVGVGSEVRDISNLHLSYKRARAAITRALIRRERLVCFDEMGTERLFALMPDQQLLREMGEDLLKPLIDYDREHDGAYVRTLLLYLEYNGSIHRVADQLFTHRNTVLYRLDRIRTMLGCPLESAQDRLKYHIACLICQSRQGSGLGEVHSQRR